VRFSLTLFNLQGALARSNGDCTPFPAEAANCVPSPYRCASTRDRFAGSLAGLDDGCSSVAEIYFTMPLIFSSIPFFCDFVTVFVTRFLFATRFPAGADDVVGPCDKL